WIIGHDPPHAGQGLVHLPGREIKRLVERNVFVHEAYVRLAHRPTTIFAKLAPRWLSGDLCSACIDPDPRGSFGSPAGSWRLVPPMKPQRRESVLSRSSRFGPLILGATLLCVPNILGPELERSFHDPSLMWLAKQCALPREEPRADSIPVVTR